MWLIMALVTAVAIVLAFTYVDVPVSLFAARHLKFFDHALEILFSSRKVLAIETAMVIILVAIRLVLGYLPPLAKAWAIGCMASICAFLVNDLLLKRLFGVPSPFDLVAGADHAFHFLHGAPQNGFPSGHMMLAGAFAGVFMQRYRLARPYFSALLLLAAVLLVAGNWHFLSDIFAGTYLGLATGFFAGYLLQIYERRRHGPLKRAATGTISATSRYKGVRGASAPGVELPDPQVQGAGESHPGQIRQEEQGRGPADRSK